MDNSRSKLQWCILIYSILLCFIIFIVFTFQTKNKYFRWGVPDNNEEPLIIIFQLELIIIINIVVYYYL